MDLDRMVKEAKERLNRSIGQRARFAKAAVAADFERRRLAVATRMTYDEEQEIRNRMYRRMLENLAHRPSRMYDWSGAAQQTKEVNPADLQNSPAWR